MASFSTTTVSRVLPVAYASFHVHESTERWVLAVQPGSKKRRNRVSTTLRASTSDARDGGGGGSYLDMWKSALERDRKAIEFQNIVGKSTGNDVVVQDDLQKKSEQFNEILNASREERDRIQRMQVIDRAAAAIAAARAILKETIGLKEEEGDSVSSVSDNSKVYESGFMANHPEESGESENEETAYESHSETQGNGIPGPDFWSWTPPPSSDTPPHSESNLQAELKPSVLPTTSKPVMEKERSVDFLSIPLESSLAANEKIRLSPLRSSIDVTSLEASQLKSDASFIEEEEKVGVMFSANAAEVAHALQNLEELSSPNGVKADGSRWWKETGIEKRPDGVICRWAMTRGVSADETLEWQEKYWEAADEFGYKELGSEKSGRDATGNVWREYWRESMGQECGLMRIEKTADKWGKNGKGDEWQEQWWELYNASCQAEKWAHKWCSIDPNTPLEAGHAHLWHERWGEKYDGHGGSIKYTDKWAERKEGDGWTKWGDKWDENFDLNANGVKQGETWWEGKYRERWNRTWGERHNGSGWVHKYGKSSSGEHWDTHVPEETWYERFPHYGFYHSFDNSVQLRAVPKPSEMIEP